MKEVPSESFKEFANGKPKEFVAEGEKITEKDVIFEACYKAFVEVLRPCLDLHVAEELQQIRDRANQLSAISKEVKALEKEVEALSREVDNGIEKGN